MVVLDVVSRLRGFAFEEEFSPPEFFRDQLYLAFYFFFPVHQPLGGVEKKDLGRRTFGSYFSTRSYAEHISFNRTSSVILRVRN